MMEYVLIGKIVNTFGIKGEVKIESHTDFVEDRFLKDSKVYIGDEKMCEVVHSHRIHKGFILVCFKDKLNINFVEKYKGMNIYKASQDIKPLNEGEYYFSDLRDLDVYVNGIKVGKVLFVEQGITCNYLRIEKNNKEYLVPYLKNFIEGVDLNNSRVDIKDIEGLL